MKKENSKKIKESILSTINEGILDVPGQVASGLANFGRGAVGAYRMGRLNKQLDQAAASIDKNWDSAEKTAAQLAQKMSDSKNPQVAQDGANAIQNVKSAASDIKKATTKLRQISKAGAGKAQNAGQARNDNFEFREYEDEHGMIHREGPFDRWLKKFGFDHLDNKPQKGRMQSLFLQLQGSGIDPFGVSPSEGMRILNFDSYRNGVTNSTGKDPYARGEHFVSILGPQRALQMGLISDQMADFYNTPEGKNYIKRVMDQSSASYEEAQDQQNVENPDIKKQMSKGARDVKFAAKAQQSQLRGQKARAQQAEPPGQQQGSEDIYSQMGQNIQANMGRGRVPMARRERAPRQIQAQTPPQAPQTPPVSQKAQTAPVQSAGLKKPLQKLNLSPEDQGQPKTTTQAAASLLNKLKNLKSRGVDIKSWVAQNRAALLKKYQSQSDVAAINSLSGQPKQMPAPAQIPASSQTSSPEMEDPASEENIYSAMGQAQDPNFMKSKFEPKKAMKSFVNQDEDEDIPDFGGMNLKSMYGAEDEDRGPQEFSAEDAAKFEDAAKSNKATWEESPENLDIRKKISSLKMPPETSGINPPKISDTLNLPPPVEDKGSELQVGTPERPGFKPSPEPAKKKRKEKKKG